jgi:hypothetical protein
MVYDEFGVFRRILPGTIGVFHSSFPEMLQHNIYHLQTHPQSMQRARALLDGGVAQMVDLPPLPQAQAAGVLPVGPWPGAVSVRTRPARSFLSAN